VLLPSAVRIGARTNCFTPELVGGAIAVRHGIYIWRRLSTPLEQWKTDLMADAINR